MSENTDIFSKVLGTKKLNYFAEISYSFYIMQSFCSNFLSCFLPDIKQPYSTIAYLMLNFGMAVIVHEIFERGISSFLKKCVILMLNFEIKQLRLIANNYI
jgi:hypothetical protein